MKSTNCVRRKLLLRKKKKKKYEAIVASKMYVVCDRSQQTSDFKMEEEIENDEHESITLNNSFVKYIENKIGIKCLWKIKWSVNELSEWGKWHSDDGYSVQKT